MKEMVLMERIGFFLVEVNSFCDACIPYPSEILRRVHYHLPFVAAEANNVLLIIIKVRDNVTLTALHFIFSHTLLCL